MGKTLRMRHVSVSWLCVAMVAACLSACGSADQSDGAAGLHGKSSKDRHPASLADPTADMNAAVSAAKAPSPVNIKFRMSERPEPGKPASVDFVLIPDPTVVSLAAKFEGDEGLTVISGDQVPTVDKPAPNVPIRHTVTVVPKADGIYIMTATLTVATDDDSKVRAFSIPLIAGQGLPQLAAH